MDFLHILYQPITWILEGFNLFTPNFGWSIILLACFFYILLIPIKKWALNIQNTQLLQAELVQNEVLKIKKLYSRKELFEKTEELYKKIHYNPFSPLKGLIGFLVQVPILLLTYSCLLNSSHLTSSFGYIGDLSSTDGLISIADYQLNLLPLIMFICSITSATIFRDNQLSSKQTKKQRYNGMLISTVFLMLLYNAPSGIVMYWTIITLLDLLFTILKRYKLKYTL